jgi:3-hydroxybutyryl-CoA dehydratase
MCAVTADGSIAPAASGMYFEDLEVGFSMCSPGRTITQTDIIQFAALSGDYNELHTNAEFAKGTPFGQPVVYGLLGLAAASGLLLRTGLGEGTAIAFTSLEWKFAKPMFAGDTVHVEVVVERTRAVRAIGGGMAILGFKLINQRDEVVQEGTWRVLVKSAPQGS